LFALTLDPFLRMLLLRIPMRLSTIVAFADDLAAVLLDLADGLKKLFPLFALLFRAAGLAINPRKTVIVPLGSATSFWIRRFIHDCIPAWASVKIEDCGTLLGIWLGPGAGAVRWKDTTDKFLSRARDSKATHFAFEETLRHYRVHSFSVLSHLCQFCLAPPEVLDAEDRALQGLTRGPFGVFPRGALATLTELGLRFEAPDLGVTNRAAMLRTAMGSEQFHSAMIAWEEDFCDDNALVAPRRDPWFDDSCTAHLIRIYKAHNKLVTNTPTNMMGYGLLAALHADFRSAFPKIWPSLLLRRMLR
jgi:hypothetical protein